MEKQVKKNIVFLAQSLDGFIAGPNGEIDWLDTIPNPEQNDMGYVALMNEIDAIVMGRASFDFVKNYDGPWPYQKHVFVLSNTLTKIPEVLMDKASLLNGNVSQILDILHDKGFYSLYIDGGKTIQSFLKEDMIDELRITTIPIILGDGIPLYGIMDKSLVFNHIKTEVFLGQLVQSQYSRIR